MRLMPWRANFIGPYTTEEVDGGTAPPPANLGGGLRSEHIMVRPLDLELHKPMPIHIPFVYSVFLYEHSP
jgi:hypothetical protein